MVDFAALDRLRLRAEEACNEAQFVIVECRLLVSMSRRARSTPSMARTGTMTGAVLSQPRRSMAPVCSRGDDAPHR